MRLDRQVTTQRIADYGRSLDDVRAALDWSFSAVRDASIGVGLAVAAIPLWVLRHFHDGQLILTALSCVRWRRVYLGSIRIGA